MLLRRPHKLSLPSAHMPPCPPYLSHPVSGCGGNCGNEDCGKEDCGKEDCGKEDCGNESCGDENCGNGEEAQTFIANLDLDLDLAQALKLPTAAASLPSTTPSKACSTIAASFHPTCPLQTQMHSSHDTNHPTESAPRMGY